MHRNFKIKKVISILLALLGCLFSSHSVALTLGDIQVKSTLGQALLAQVKINGADSNIDESCFNVTSEDPENGVMLKYNPSDALVTIQSQQAVAKPAMVLTLFNHCQAPSKRNYIFFVNAQESSANNQNAKNETPKKILGDQFHYQRIFNKLTKETEQELSARGLPDRFIYEDQLRDSRLNSNTAPMSTEGIPAGNSLSVKEPSTRVVAVGDKTNKNPKSTDKFANNALKNTSIQPKTEANKLALAKTISATPSKTPEFKATISKINETETKPILNISTSSTSESEGAVSANSNVDGTNEGDLINPEDSPLISEEQLLAEKRMLELQAQLTELYKINSSLDNLFKKLNHELTQVRKENDFLRSLALCLGGALLMSSYFFADWLRRKKSQPVYDREPAMWTSQNPSVKPDSADSQFAVSSTTNNNNATSANNMFTDNGFAAANNTSSRSYPLPGVTDVSKHTPLGGEHPLSVQAPEAKWFDLGEPVPKTSEQTIHTAPVDITVTPSPTQPITPQPPVLTITRVASPLSTPDSAPATGTTNSIEHAAPTTKANSSEPKKDVIKVLPAGVMDDVDVFLSHGRTNLAIQLLQNYLMEHPKESALVWIFLLDLLAKEGKRREYEITTEECRKHFNIKLSDFSVPVANNDSIESFERISAALQKVWGTPLVLSFIDELIYNTRLVPRIGFNRAIFEELMLLRELAEEELRMDQTQIQPTPASMTNREVSDEFKQLAEDLKTQDQRKQDVNQYLSQFEFNLEDLSK